MDILDIYAGRFYKLHTGTYYERLPEIGEHIKKELPTGDYPNIVYAEGAKEIGGFGSFINNNYI